MTEFDPHVQAGEQEAERIFKNADRIGKMLVEGFHLLGLFAIGAATVWAGATAFGRMFLAGAASIEDLLLLFIYLEIGAMVGIYFTTNKMPVRFLIYVSITVMTRHLIGYVNTVHVPDVGLLIMSASVLLLSLSILIIRYASHYFPSSKARASVKAEPRGLSDLTLC